MTAPDTTLRGKPHFEVLDGLRGTAALLVVAFHIQGITVLFEADRLLLPHAYLAVDFFSRCRVSSSAMPMTIAGRG
jgi:peptidoglycan/LPS O-acetylase OafA/YrhL